MGPKWALCSNGVRGVSRFQGIRAGPIGPFVECVHQGSVLSVARTSPLPAGGLKFLMKRVNGVENKRKT